MANRYKYVIFLADPQSPNWTLQVIQQADCILLVDGLEEPRDPEIEETFGRDIDRATNVVHLVVVHSPHPTKHSKKSSVSPLLRDRSVHILHNITEGDEQDFSRLCRIVTGNGIGLALGGGSARGLAHCGVIKALREQGIPIDIIGGTSAGSIIAAFHAQGMPLNEIAEVFTSMFNWSNWLQDFTLPFMSFLSAHKLGKTMQQVFGEKHIEDLRLPMFAVSTNMNTYKEHIHKRGLLWMALRCSIALPPFLPPVKTGEGIFVDGGFVNKVPTEICRTFGASFVIGSDVSFKSHFAEGLPEDYVDTESGLHILLSKLWGGFGYLSIMNIMTELGYLIDYNKKSKLEADLFIVPEGMHRYGTFVSRKEAPEIIQRGYEETKHQLKELRENQPKIWKKLAIEKHPERKHPDVFIAMVENGPPVRKTFRPLRLMFTVIFLVLTFRWRQAIKRVIRATFRVVKRYLKLE